jgi:hypothetical protein
MPAVAVRSRPNGLPIATAASPTSTCDESPSAIGSSASAGASTSITAMSVEGSEPSSSASNDSPSSVSVTSMFSAPATTCALVMIRPCSSITKPEPVAVPPPPSGAPNGLSCACPLPESALMKATPGAASP